MTAKTPHHHGNLRAALIEAGLGILHDEGLEALTLRKVAARAGVSHAAPAHHFDGKFGVLVAIATHGFEVFTAHLEADRYLHGPAPYQQLQGICQGYLRFAEEQHALFQLIFTTEYKNHVDQELSAASAASFAVLSDVCSLFEPAKSEHTNEMSVWSLVHGYAMLRTYSHSRSPVTGDVVPFDVLLERLALTPRSA